MYAKCGDLVRARLMFDDLSDRSVVTWNSLISGYVFHGLNHEALRCFRQMKDEGFSPSVVTYISILKACGSIGAADEGDEVHVEISMQESLQNNLVLNTALVDMYAKCGAISKAQDVFDKMPARNIAAWTALISGYAQQGFCDEAFRCFDRMQVEGFSPDMVTFICILKACGSAGMLERGRLIHFEVQSQGLLAKGTAIGNALVDMYMKCDAYAEAQEVFESLMMRDVTTWTTMIAGFASSKHAANALIYFKLMQNEGHVPNAVTYICILKACASLGDVDFGRKIHEEVEEQGLLNQNKMVATAVIDMFLKCGLLAMAQEIFDKLSDPNVVTWNVLLGGYAQHELGNKTVTYFAKMINEGVLPDATTFLCVLKACGSIGALQLGIKIHEKIQKQINLEENELLCNALVDMYMKCGVVHKAQAIFDGAQRRTITEWNALIAGYAQVGMVRTVLEKYSMMRREGTHPSAVTYIILLTMYSHEGLIEEGLDLFNTMFTTNKISLTSEHYGCIVDIFSRAGQFEEAIGVIKKVPQTDVLVSWSAFIGSCTNQTNFHHGIPFRIQ
ncbi:hypothetical protein KP509_05G035900 [Ceratopteris richardii]|nr:hypothetical protein KP509_05G035900 [Ceratopteris richardii]